jgi:VWFA-related protein
MLDSHWVRTSLLHSFFGFLFICAATVLWAQGPGSDEVRGSSHAYMPPAKPASEPTPNAITVRTQVVSVGVVVRDTKGNVVSGLKQGDFQVFDNGKPQPISAFSVEALAPQNRPGAAASAASAPPLASVAASVPPRFIALYFDDVHAESGDLDRAKAAAKTLIQSGVEPGDELAIFTGSSVVSLDFTTDAARVFAALDKITPHPRMSGNGLPGCPAMTPYEAYLVNNHLDLVIQDRLVEDAQRCMCDIDITDATCKKQAEEVVTVKAEQTWDQTLQISQLTLETLRGVVNYLAKMAGQRVLVLASAGYLNEGLELGYEQDLVVEAALHAGIVINSIDLKGLVTGGPSGTVTALKDINKDTKGMAPYELMYDSITFGQKTTALNASMWELADATGGMFFHNNNDLGKGFRRLADAPEIEYEIVYAPENIKEDGKFHKIQVKLVNPRSYLVQARLGYFAPTKEMAKAGSVAAPAASGAAAPPISPIDREMLGDDAVTDLPATVSVVKTGPDPSDKPALLANVHVDVRMLSFEHKDDRSVQELTFVLALFDEHGTFISGQEGEMDLSLKEPTLENFEKNGLNAKLWLEAPPGNYRLRAVAREAVAGKMFASSQPVEIH